MEEIFRGISNEQHVGPKRIVKIDAFQFQSRDADDTGYIRESVNWNLDEGSLKEILYRKNPDGEYKFKGGVGELSVSEIQIMLQLFVLDNTLRLDKDPDPNCPGNPYHGNIGIKEDADRPTVAMIRNCLCALVKVIHPRQD